MVSKYWLSGSLMFRGSPSILAAERQVLAAAPRNMWKEAGLRWKAVGLAPTGAPSGTYWEQKDVTRSPQPPPGTC